MFHISVSKADALVKTKETLTSGRVGAQIKFDFTSDWDGLGKTAVFYTNGGDKIAVLIGSDNTITIPYEVLTDPKKNLIGGVYGTNGDDDDLIVIPTIYFPLGYIENGTTIDDADNAGTPTPTDVQQMLGAAAEATGAIIHSATADVTEDGGELRAEAEITGTSGHKTLAIHLFNTKGKPGEGSSVQWSDVLSKPFTTIGSNLRVNGGSLAVDTSPSVESGNTKPITSNAVFVGLTAKVSEPTEDGTNGQVLTTDGNGGRSWTTVQGGGGTSDYDDLENKPKINSVELSGNKSLDDLSIAPKTHTHTVSNITDFPTIPTVPTNVSAFVNDAGYLTSHQDISGKENTANKVTSISSSSTDAQYPSAKCVYDAINTAIVGAIEGAY